jgi:hypothetical protein
LSVRGAASRILSTLSWGLAVVLLFATWIVSIHRSPYSLWTYVIPEVGAMFLLFFVTGLEIAYTNLRDKDSEQVDPTIREFLIFLQLNEHKLYEAREWFGVALVAILALLCEFDPASPMEFIFHTKVHLLPDERIWKFLFALFFTTLPAVWFAQSPAKVLAINNSQNFIRKASFLRVPLTWAWTILDGLQSDALTELVYGPTFVRWKEERRNLSPSNSAFYVSALKRYGSGFHEIEQKISILPGGRAKVTQTGLIHVVSSDKRVFTRTIYLDGKYAGDGKITITKHFRMPAAGENLKEIEGQIASCGNNPMPKGFEIRDTGDCKATPEPDPQKPREISFVIRAQAALAGKDPAYTALIGYELECSWENDSFWMAEYDKDFYRVSASSPVRHLLLELRFDAATDRRFASPTPQVRIQDQPHQEEEGKINAGIPAGDHQCLIADISFPLVGASYGVEWTVWKKN